MSARPLGAQPEPGLPEFILVSIDFSGHAWAGCHVCGWQTELHGGEVGSGGGRPNADALAAATGDAWRHAVEKGHIAPRMGPEVWRGRTDPMPGISNSRVSLVALEVSPGTEIVVRLAGDGAP